MKRIKGIGGVFFKCANPDLVKEWYDKHLGLNTDKWGTNFEWRHSDENHSQGFTQWSPFSDKTDYFNPSTKEFMINLIVEDLTQLVEELKLKGVKILDDIETFDYGKFVHILDLEGNKIELWEPNAVVYDTLVIGRTK